MIKINPTKLLLFFSLTSVIAFAQNEIATTKSESSVTISVPNLSTEVFTDADPFVEDLTGYYKCSAKCVPGNSLIRIDPENTDISQLTGEKYESYVEIVANAGNIDAISMTLLGAYKIITDKCSEIKGHTVIDHPVKGQLGLSYNFVHKYIARAETYIKPVCKIIGEETVDEE